MPATSKSQRRLFAMWEHGVPTTTPKPKGLTHEQMHHYAATKEKGLPKYVTQRKKREGKSNRFLTVSR